MCFINSFGTLQDINNCSTGTKAIIYAINYPEKIVNISEAGRRHYLTIINNSAVYDAQFSKSESYDAFLEYDEESKDISIIMDGYEFTKLSRLEYYLRKEKDEDDVEVDLRREGIKVV